MSVFPEINDDYQYPDILSSWDPFFHATFFNVFTSNTVCNANNYLERQFIRAQN